jgi:ribose transport system permease protein
MIAWFKSGFSARRSRQGLWGVPMVIALALAVILAVGTDQFATRENLFNLIAQAMPLLIAAIGQLFVILVGGLDLSIGSVISFSTAILSLDGPAVVLIPAVFLLAGLVGLINGLVITRLNVHPIIATLAMQYILLGITRILRPVSGGTIPDVVIAAVQGSVLGVPLPLFWG